MHTTDKKKSWSLSFLSCGTLFFFFCFHVMTFFMSLSVCTCVLVLLSVVAQELFFLFCFLVLRVISFSFFVCWKRSSSKVSRCSSSCLLPLATTKKKKRRKENSREKKDLCETLYTCASKLSVFVQESMAEVDYEAGRPFFFFFVCVCVCMWRG